MEYHNQEKNTYLIQKDDKKFYLSDTNKTS